MAWVKLYVTCSSGFRTIVLFVQQFVVNKVQETLLHPSFWYFKHTVACVLGGGCGGRLVWVWGEVSMGVEGGSYGCLACNFGWEGCPIVPRNPHGSVPAFITHTTQRGAHTCTSSQYAHTHTCTDVTVNIHTRLRVLTTCRLIWRQLAAHTAAVSSYRQVLCQHARLTEWVTCLLGVSTRGWRVE